MRKILCLLLSIILCFTLVACGQNSSLGTPSTSEKENISEEKVKENLAGTNINIKYVTTNKLHYDTEDNLLVNFTSKNDKNVYTVFSFASQQTAGNKYQLKNLHNEVIAEFISDTDFYHIVTLNIPDEDYTLWSNGTQFAAFSGSKNINVSLVTKFPEDTTNKQEESIIVNGDIAQKDFNTNTSLNVKVEGSPSPMFHITLNNVMFSNIAEYQGDD